MVNTNQIPAREIRMFNYTLTVEKKAKKKYEYRLKNKANKTLFKYTTDKRPMDINHTNPVVTEIMKKLSGNVVITNEDGISARVDDTQIKDLLMDNLLYLDEDLDAYLESQTENIEDAREKYRQEKLRELEEKADEFLNFLYTHHLDIYTFIWYASEWLSGGESQNTITGFICHLSTYFGIKPVWFLALGKAGDGKTVIENSSEKLIPPNAFLNGRVSESAIHRKSLQRGENYLDCKILRMGDFGGKHDLEKWEGTIDKYKELTTDGETEIELTSDSVDEETGERGITLFKLTGYPSVSLTSVNSESFDDQIMSRSVNVSPVATNEAVKKYFYFNKGLVAEERDRIIDEEISLFHAYIEYVKLKYSDVEVINPYWECLERWFKDSEYYKRSLDLYPSLVNAVTLLNYENREIITNDYGKQYLVCSKQDNQIVADIFNPSQGISEPAIRIFNLMLKWYEKFDPDELYQYNEGRFRIRDCDTIFNTSEIKNKGSKIRSLKGLKYGEIVSSLNNHCLIEPVDKMKRGNKNIYALSHHEPLVSKRICFDDEKIHQYVKDMEWMYALSPTPLEKIVFEKNEDKDSDGVVMDLKLPPWVSKCPYVALGCPVMPVKPELMYRPCPQNCDEKSDDSPLMPANENISGGSGT